MTTRVDPRLAERRRTVAENDARKRLRRIFWTLALIFLAGTIAWIAQSPWFSIAHVALSGVRESDTPQILEAAGVVEGTPLIAVRTGQVEELLEADPWVVEATVRRVIPDAIEVEITERKPLAWIQNGTRWAAVADDLTVLRYDLEPNGPVMIFDLATGERGFRDPRVSGGLDFLIGLSDEIRPRASLREHNGELWAQVADLSVRLGQPTEMSQKAAALAAILEEGLPPGSTVNLVAPTRPAVIEPSS